MLCGSLKLQHRLERDCDRAFLILCFFLTNANVGMKFAPNLAVFFPLSLPRYRTYQIFSYIIRSAAFEPCLQDVLTSYVT